MINCRTLISVCLVVASLMCNARKVDEGTAREIGMNFLEKRVSNNSPKHNIPSKGNYELAYTATKDGLDCYYVYNRKNGGFVIVSADERSKSHILGYSLTGSFNYENMGDSARWWVDSYKDYIYSLATLSSVSAPKRPTVAGKAVEPLLGDNLWHQFYPYNALCPDINGTVPPTGCVANAMAQVMQYHKWPVQGMGSISYTWDYTGKTIFDNFSES